MPSDPLPDGEFRPIAGDEHVEPILELLGSIGNEHLLVRTITTAAAEVWQSTGAHHQHVIVLELEGRWNRTDQTGTEKAVLPLEAAMILFDNLAHTLRVLAASGAKLPEV